MITSFAYDLAKRHLDIYSDQSDTMKAHSEAMECRDCEDFLQLGINAFNWVKRAEEGLREAVYSGQRDSNHDVAEAFDILYEQWLVPVDPARKWAKQQIDRGYIPDNLKEFEEVREAVEDIVEKRSWAFTAELDRSKSEESW